MRRCPCGKRHRVPFTTRNGRLVELRMDCPQAPPPEAHPKGPPEVPTSKRRESAKIRQCPICGEWKMKVTSKHSCRDCMPIAHRRRLSRLSEGGAA